jgi:MarR family transcriptional regulator, organic hydroperoxide resistance regulator
MTTSVTVSPATAPMPHLGDDLEFLRLMWSVTHGLERTSKQMERTLGVTGPQRLVIRLLGRFPGVTLARVASLLQVHPSTASGIVKRLEQRGLVSRRADRRDRRRAYLGLTEAGRRLDMETAGTVETAVHRVLSSVPGPSIEGARVTLAALARQLDACAVDPTRE